MLQCNVSDSISRLRRNGARAATFALPVVLVAAATWLYGLLHTAIGSPPPLFTTFYPVTVVAAIVGGFGPGLAATLLSAVCANYFLMSPPGQLKFGNLADDLNLLVFLAMGIAISVLIEYSKQGRLRSEQLLRKANAYHRGLIETSLDPLITIDANGLITDVNTATEVVTGWPRDALIGTAFCNYFADPGQAQAGYQEAFHTGSVRDHALDIRNRDGRLTPVLYNAAVYRDESGAVMGIFAAARDITDQKRAHEQLQELAHIDPLTRLPNRRLLADRLQQAIAQNIRNKRTIALCYLDLDGFKPVNDSLGHSVGDQLLTEVAGRLMSVVRAGDTVARIGGDEFVLLLTGLTCLEECEQILTRVLSVIAAPYMACGNNHSNISASIGVTLSPPDECDPDTLFRHADQSMYIAKQNGRNRFQLFDSYLEQRVAGRRETFERIRHGLETGQFLLYYQPKVDFSCKAIVGVEALLRWQHPILGLMGPAEFLPIVENTELANSMGEWVIREALSHLRMWRAAGIDLQVSVNTFARQLQAPDFVPNLHNLLSEFADIPNGRLKLEITETAALPDLSMLEDVIAACHASGVDFSLDDFGTGYASLNYLRHLSAVELKIDQSFVSGMLVNHEDKSIVEAIIGLGRAFERSIVAEGVETPEQIRILLDMGCHIIQGYVITHPMQAEQVAEWIRQVQFETLFAD
jgi:diguanylate cyclase (GGDEF)-like protein/PAS domain S-box-containing protein